MYNLNFPPVHLIIIILILITLQTLTAEVYTHNIQNACTEYIKTSCLFHPRVLSKAAILEACSADPKESTTSSQRIHG